MPYMSAIIPTFNSSNTIGKLLQSLEPVNSEDLEIIVVDDGSSDSTVELCRTFSRTQVIIMERNSGPAAARNRGAQAAQGEVLLFLDDDAVIRNPELIIAMIQHFKDDPELTTISTISHKYPENKGFLARYTALLEHIIYQRAIKNPIMNPWYDFSTRCGAIKRSLFDAVGGFDASYALPSVEDAEFYYRLAKHKPGILLAEFPIGHHWPTRFWKLMRNYFVRGTLWTPLFLSRRQFDDVLTTRGESVTKLIDFFSFASLLFGLFSDGLLLVGLLLFVISLFRKRTLLKEFHHEYGALFTIKATILHYLQSVAIVSGGGVGALHMLVRKLAKPKPTGTQTNS